MFKLARPETWLIVALAALAPPLALLRSQATVLDAARRTATLEAPASVSLGHLRAGEEADGSLRLLNRSPFAARVARVDSSCPCVRLAGWPATIDPGVFRDLPITFDPAEEPDFRGTLAVDLTGLGPSGEVLFRTTAGLIVSGPVMASPTVPASVTPGISAPSSLEVFP